MPRGTAPLAKLSRPRVFGAIARERLFALLDDRLRRPAVWISGPPGAGKTTLVASYLEARKRHAVWYQLDGGDTDVATFFYYLGVAAQGLVGRRALRLPALTPEYLPDLIGFTRRFFRELFARLPRRSLLVFDDYHEVPSDSRLHGVIACGLAELPEGFGCLVASRAEPLPEYARLTANQSIVSLGWDELRLTEEETAEIARNRQVADASVIRAVHARSDGWLAGLILLLGQTAAKPAKAASVLAPSSKSLSDYFAGIFNNLSSETRDVLLSTALLTSVTELIAARLSGNEHAGRVLQQLHENNCFVQRRAGSEPAYQTHALFHEFLLKLVHERWTPGERLRRLRETAEMLVEFGKDEEAAALYGQAGDWELASRLVISLAPGLLSQGRWQTLQTRIAALPPAEVEARPWLQFWLGASEMAVDPERARRTLTRAYADFVGKGDAIGQLLAAATSIEIQFVLWADFAMFDRWIEALGRLLEQGVAFPDANTEIRVLSNLVAALTFRAPWHPKLGVYKRRLLELTLSDAAPFQRLVAAGNLAHHFAWRGELQSAIQAVSIARPLLMLTDIAPVHKLWGSMSLAYAAYARADHDDGETLLSQAVALSEEHGLTYADFWIRAADCWHRLDRGEYKTVASILDRLEASLTGGRGMDVSHFHLVKGWLALLEGHFVLARQEIEAAKALAARVGTTYTESYHDLMLAEVLIELGEYAQAEDWIAHFRATFGAVESALIEFNALLVDAYLGLAKGGAAGCAAALRSAFSLGRTSGYVQTFNWYGRMMSRLCAFALEHGIEPEYTKMLIRRRGLVPETPIESWPWPIRIYTLGRFEILKDDAPITFEGKAQHKPIDLLKVMIALGGKDVAADKLIGILWPEPPEDGGQKVFDITVHRLRKLLGGNAVLVADRRATLNPAMVWVDAWALERTLAPLVPAVNQPPRGIREMEEAAPAVLALYRGHFLADDVEEPWQIPVRNRLSGRFARFVLQLGEHWEATGQWLRAAEFYQRGIELDPLAETFYRRRMLCLRAQGLRAEAIEVFRQCRQALSVMLGVKPSTETEAVYRSLLAAS